MLIGFVILIVSALPAPVSERIYPTIEACEHIKARLHDRRPLVQLECAGSQAFTLLRNIANALMV